MKAQKRLERLMVQVTPKEKSVLVDGLSVFPINAPKTVAPKLERIINDRIKRAYQAGARDAVSRVRRSLALPTLD